MDDIYCGRETLLFSSFPSLFPTSSFSLRCRLLLVAIGGGMLRWIMVTLVCASSVCGVTDAGERPGKKVCWVEIVYPPKIFFPRLAVRSVSISYPSSTRGENIYLKIFYYMNLVASPVK